MISPPGILEINIENIKKPFVQDIFSISDDDGDYISFDIIDANSDYIVTHLMSTTEMKPVVRIFKRNSKYFSIGHTEFKYVDFVDQSASI